MFVVENKWQLQLKQKAMKDQALHNISQAKDCWYPLGFWHLLPHKH